ncbi:contact-dependent growth inhibition system immunity protein [Streptomyces californicus]|uniref:contact-dependent growth inhibition system immunity protein n=1 Tax=Streptomyces californicus TaxID=67351 RepID=UPI0036C2D691
MEASHLPMKQDINGKKTLEQLEGIEWPAPSPNATALVNAAHELRKRPVDSLNTHELSRLIGQDIGIHWLLPIALNLLHRTAHDQPWRDFYDDDLLTAALTRRAHVWRSDPSWVTRMKEIIAALDGISPYIQEEIRTSLKESGDQK